MTNNKNINKIVDTIKEKVKYIEYNRVSGDIQELLDLILALSSGLILCLEEKGNKNENIEGKLNV